MAHRSQSGPASCPPLLHCVHNQLVKVKARFSLLGTVQLAIVHNNCRQIIDYPKINKESLSQEGLWYSFLAMWVVLMRSRIQLITIEIILSHFRSLKANFISRKETNPGKISDQCCVCERRLGILNISHNTITCETCSKHVCRHCVRGGLCSYCYVLR